MRLAQPSGGGTTLWTWVWSGVSCPCGGDILAEAFRTIQEAYGWRYNIRYELKGHCQTCGTKAVIETYYAPIVGAA